MVNLLRKLLRKTGGGTFLARLRADRAGNVLALTAACVPPILLLVGGGIDMSRAYMAQTALQNACDAGVLAGRRASAKSGQFRTGAGLEVEKATKMFNFNFNGTAQSANASGTTFVPTDAGSGVISASAATTVPTTLMKIFGTNSFSLSATCSAEYQISNIDVMMVLDTTGSMACDVNGSNCNSGTTSKIYGLKAAVRSFYTTIASAVPSGSQTRVRFGFVPYAGTVNLKNLVSGSTPDIPQSYFSSTTNYQTKLYRFDQPVTQNTTTTSTSTSQSTETYSSAISQADCTSYSTNDYPSSGSNPVTSGNTTTTYSYGSWTKTGTVTSGKNKNQTTTDVGTCVRNLSIQTTTTTTTPVTVGYSLNPSTPYRYVQAAVDTSGIKALTAIRIATAVSASATVPLTGYTDGWYDPVRLGSLAGTTGVTVANYTWGGCVEERNTVNSLFVNNAVPAGAYDHDLATAPTNAATTWHPYFEYIEYNRNQSAALDSNNNISSEYDRMVADNYRLCVPAAMKFTTVDTSAPNTVPTWIQNYLATLTANGNTYHDIGMVWGARLANPNGIMAANVNDGNVTSVSRHIIFLTDGAMAPNGDIYNSYGLEQIDNRVAPNNTSDSTLTNYHNQRFTAACATARAMGYTIWVIGFGQSISTEMTACAAGSGGKAMFAGSTSDLQTVFNDIASRIADLRLKA